MTTPAQQKMEKLSKKEEDRRKAITDEREIKKSIDKALKSRTGRLQDGVKQDDFEKTEIDRLRHEEKILKFEEQFYSELKVKMEHYVVEVNKIKASIPGKAIIQVAPLIPIIPHSFMIDPNVLRTAGIKMVLVGGYCIFEKQFLLGINFKELSKEYAPVDNYRIECKKFLDKIRDLESQFGELTQLQAKIEKIMTIVDNAKASLEDDKRELEALVLQPNASEEEIKSHEYSSSRLTKLIEQKSNFIALKESEESTLSSTFQSLEKQYAPILAEHEETQEQYRLYKSLNGHVIKGQNSNFSEKLFQFLMKSVKQINENLSTNDQLVFPETGLNFEKMASGLLPKEVRPQPVMLGDMAYYWVMKVKDVHKWHKAIQGKHTDIRGWTFPHILKSKVHQALEKEAKQKTGLVDEILRCRKLNYSKEETLKKAKIFLIKHGDPQYKMDDYFAGVFEKVWAEADEILGSRTAKNPSVPKMRGTHMSSSLLASIKRAKPAE